MINPINTLFLIIMSAVVAFLLIAVLPPVLYLSIKEVSKTDGDVSFREDPKAQKIFFTGLVVFLIIFTIAF